uniref:Ras homolog family member F, filopodia associated n=2 Tax=Canis lupus familiaris TaxID=9615 RepID=A0A8C0PDM4_CANLF
MDAPGAPGPGPGRKELKIVIVGDGGCGKTSLLMVYSQGSFPEDYAPSVFEKYTASVTVGSKEVTLNLYDTAGQEDYDRLRPLSYQNTHLVLICYDVMNPTSYDNVLIKWFPEVTHFCRGTPMVLIGCKTDLRKDKEQLRKLRAAQLEPITYMQLCVHNFECGQKIAKEEDEECERQHEHLAGAGPCKEMGEGWQGEEGKGRKGGASFDQLLL